MSITASTVLSVAATTLQDPGYTRWTQAELIGYLNDGVRELITIRPDANVKVAPITPAVGARQTLPSEAVALIDILGNTSGKQRQITKVDINILSATNRDWQSSTASATALHFMYDLRNPRTYYLYPPADGTGGIDMLYSVFPSDATTAGSVIPLADQWRNALTNYVLARAYSKDAEYGGNAQFAAQYMQLFTGEVGGQLQAASAVDPKQ